ncbi:MAG: GIY-YIG nuclease family protein [Eubacteriaceae bacterium]|nr:GIY-YIG nuclease family protein [Eubacteriaceae bacterium]
MDTNNHSSILYSFFEPFYRLFRPVFLPLAVILIATAILNMHEAWLYAVAWKKLHKLFPNPWRVSAKKFLDAKASRKFKAAYNFPGVYIIKNKTRRMGYVGQGVKILDRVSSHFSGNGNKEIYDDFKKRHRFVIKLISLEGSGYKSLNELERYNIAKYNSYVKGYNKTRGNA